MVLEPEVVEERRARLLETRLPELLEQVRVGDGVARRVQRAPIGLGFVAT